MISPMKSINFDTSNNQSYLFIAEGSEIVASIFLDGGKGLSKEFAPALKNLFDKTDTKIADFDYIACGYGPGSYTGLRVGITFAKTLSYASGVPLLGFPSLTPFQTSGSAVLLDARSGGIYVQKDDLPKLVSLTDLKRELSDTQILLTPDLKPLKERLPHLTIQETNPNLALLNQKLQLQKDYRSHFELKPLYLRTP